MTIIRGTLSITPDEQEITQYDAGNVLKIPFQTKMNVRNLDAAVLELIIVKAPAPQNI